MRCPRRRYLRLRPLAGCVIASYLVEFVADIRSSYPFALRALFIIMLSRLSITPTAPPPPKTWNREYQEMSNEYLKSQNSNPIVSPRSCNWWTLLTCYSLVSRPRDTRARVWLCATKQTTWETTSIRSKIGFKDDESYLHSNSNNPKSSDHETISSSGVRAAVS